jgi:hypothetical protein
VCGGGGGRGSGRRQRPVPIPNPSSAAAVDVHNAVDFVCPHLKPQTCHIAVVIKRSSLNSLSSPVLQLHIMSLVLNAAAACPVFGRPTRARALLAAAPATGNEAAAAFPSIGVAAAVVQPQAAPIAAVLLPPAFRPCDLPGVRG